MTTIIRDRFKAGEAPCVEVNVREGDPPTATWRYEHPSGEVEGAPDTPQPAHSVFEDAKAYAEANRIPFLCIYDPYRLFVDEL